jgi:F-type H+-transporting ATPase subunit epsilon
MIRLSIATPEIVVYDADVYSVSVPGYLGYMQILPNHAPIITALRAGKVTFQSKENQQVTYAITGGFFEFSQNQASILADSVQI